MCNNGNMETLTPIEWKVLSVIVAIFTVLILGAVAAAIIMW